ncbi:MAG: beta-galactosidase GalA [Acidobacteriaceae bacterium]
MRSWTRRDLLKTGAVASAGAVASGTAFASQGHNNSSMSGDADPLLHEKSIPQPSSDLRQRILLDSGWRFHFGHASDPEKDFEFGMSPRPFAKTGNFAAPGELKFDDHDWRTLDLPHDWAVELPFVENPDTIQNGCKPLGRDFPSTSIGWYRHVFDIPASDAGKRLAIEFDGVFRNATVIFNGCFLGENLSGYAPFRFDITDFATPGAKNVLTVRVDATMHEGWFYEGAGIYRHVWYSRMDPVHLGYNDTAVYSKVERNAATVFIETVIENQSTSATQGRIHAQILSPDHKVVGTALSVPEPIAAGESRKYKLQVKVQDPSLWSPDSPHLYRLQTTALADEKPVDQEETTFGIRTIRFDARKGFFLNGKSLKIKGTCNHQDHAGVGAALPDRLQYYRLERLKAMGSNACRTSHNPPTPAFLEACDQLGMLVMDETRMFSSTPEGLSQLERMVKRDRNHPSIILWSLGNEENRVQGTKVGANIAADMKRLVRRLDPLRPVSAAMNHAWGKGISTVVDVQGCNYHLQDLDAFHQQFPNQPMIGTETASTVATRGIYENDPVKGYVSAYDLNFPRWAETAETWWKFYAEREFLSGGFVWTGFDYRGEPTPYKWPCISSHFGVLDTCGFPKDDYFYYKAWWGTEPVLHLFPHWNWASKAGQEISVWCHTNMDSVELFHNGTSLGSKSVERNGHVEWKVKYAPGSIEARGTKDGKVVLVQKRETTGLPAAIILRPDRLTITADGHDISVVAVEVVDAQGRIVPTAANMIQFQVTGVGKVIGVGNGDPSCHEPDKASQRSAFNGYCMAIVQSDKQAGIIAVEASSTGLKSAHVDITSAAVVSLPIANPKG